MKMTRGRGTLAVGLLLALALLIWMYRNRVPPQTAKPAPIASAPASTLPRPPPADKVASPPTTPLSPTTSASVQERLRHVKEHVSQMTQAEREAFDKKFLEKIKPAVDQWCKIYEGHLPFRPEEVTADTLRERAFPDRAFQGYSFVINGTTLGVCDDHGTLHVDYLMSAAANELFRIPTNPPPPAAMSVTREEILRLIKADSGGKEFPPDQIAIRPTSASGGMNGGVSVDVGEGVNAAYMPLPKFAYVFDPEGKLACYLRGLDDPPPPR